MGPICLLNSFRECILWHWRAGVCREKVQLVLVLEEPLRLRVLRLLFNHHALSFGYDTIAMTKAAPTTIVNVGYRSTNYWVVSAGTSRLLVDIGWPGTLGLMKARFKQMGVPLHEIRYAVATHYHIDHAGLAEELKREGVPLLVLEVQVAAIPIMKTWTKPEKNYVEITGEGNVTISFQESRSLLSQIGILGEVVHTPGHSEDSVSFLLDDGSVFTGDLPPEAHSWDNSVALESWRLLRKKGATCVYPAHGPIKPIDPVPPS